MTTKMNNLFEDLQGTADIKVDAIDILRYFGRVASNIKPKLITKSITYHILDEVFIICDLATRPTSEDDPQEVLDALLSIYPKLVNAAKEESKHVNIIENPEDIDYVNLIIGGLLKRYNPADYKFDNTMNK